jgi:hypothetical protein
MGDEEDKVGNKGRIVNNPWFVAIVVGAIFMVLNVAVPRAFSFIANKVVDAIGIVNHRAVDAAYNRAVARPELDYDIIILFLLLFILLIVTVILMEQPTWKSIPDFDYPWYEALERRFRQFGAFIYVFGALFIAISALGYGSLLLTTVNAARTEERRVMILTPYITDQERKELIGRWGRVETKADFDGLMNVMDGIAANHHITLPKRLDQ